MSPSLLSFVTTLVALLNTRTIVCVQKLNTIDHLQVLARHGERNPLFPVPELGEFTVSHRLGLHILEVQSARVTSFFR